VINIATGTKTTVDTILNMMKKILKSNKLFVSISHTHTRYDVPTI